MPLVVSLPIFPFVGSGILPDPSRPFLCLMPHIYQSLSPTTLFFQSTFTHSVSSPKAQVLLHHTEHLSGLSKRKRGPRPSTTPETHPGLTDSSLTALPWSPCPVPAICPTPVTGLMVLTHPSSVPFRTPRGPQQQFSHSGILLPSSQALSHHSLIFLRKPNICT